MSPGFCSLPPPKPQSSGTVSLRIPGLQMTWTFGGPVFLLSSQDLAQRRSQPGSWTLAGLSGCLWVSLATVGQIPAFELPDPQG